MQTRKNVNLAPESFRRSAVLRRLKHRARRRRRILCLLPVILVFGVLAAALLRFTPALAYADIFPTQATTRRIKDVPYISQLPTLPTGCESASAAMLLNYYGCTVTAEEFASYYLPTGDAPLYRLKSYIDNNTPVMIWATICMEPPIESDIWTVPETGREITWVCPMHALVLTGYDENGYYFSDPLAGQDIYYGKDSVEVAYTALFEQAIILTN
ncbi:MAG: C39 family peptidase [Firmicutes bacterium]|nr:C39 family peptidase [Bacillota bacterium]